MSQAAALRCVILESRRGTELARLLERHGLLAIEAPALREVPLSDQREAIAFGEALFGGACDLLVLLTGVGARSLVDALATRWPMAEILARLAATTLACRGPKPAVVLKELGLRATLTAPEPNTSRELLQALEAIELRGKRVWVQEYGRPNHELLTALRARGAEVKSAAVYAWQLPLELGPLERAIVALCEGGADALLVTSASQLDHLLEVAGRLERRAALSSALQDDVLVCSIGPVASEGLLQYGVRTDLEPVHPKMGHLVKAVAADGARVLAEKRARGASGRRWS